MPDGPKDRRGFLRIPFKTEVLIEAPGVIVRSEAEINVSMSGLLLPFSGPPLEPGTPCTASVLLQAFENRITIAAKAKVTRADGTVLAVEFTELDIDSYNHLRQLVLNNSEEPEKAEAEFNAHWGIRPAHDSSR